MAAIIFLDGSVKESARHSQIALDSIVAIDRRWWSGAEVRLSRLPQRAVAKPSWPVHFDRTLSRLAASRRSTTAQKHIKRSIDFFQTRVSGPSSMSNNSNAA